MVGVTGVLDAERKAGWIAIVGVTGDCTISVASGDRNESEDTIARRAGCLVALLNMPCPEELEGVFLTGVGELSNMESFRGRGVKGRGPVGARPSLASASSRAASRVWYRADPRFGT